MNSYSAQLQALSVFVRLAVANLLSASLSRRISLFPSTFTAAAFHSHLLLFSWHFVVFLRSAPFMDAELAQRERSFAYVRTGALLAFNALLSLASLCVLQVRGEYRAAEWCVTKVAALPLPVLRKQ